MRYIIITGIIAASCFGVLTNCSSNMNKNKKHSREYFTERFIQHENAFNELTTFFRSETSHIKDYTVTFGVSDKNRVNLILHPIVIDNSKPILGGEGLSIHSRQLDSVLNILGWTDSIVTALQNKLFKTNCGWIRTTEIRLSPVEIYDAPQGWGNFSYLIFDEPLPDSLSSVYGRTIIDSDFGKRVVLNYSSAL